MLDMPPELTQLMAVFGPLVGLVLLLVIAVALVLVLLELKRIGQALLVYDNSVHSRLRALQDALERSGPARYALAAYIAVNKDSDRRTEDLRAELESLMGEWERLDGVVDEVMVALDDAERRLGRKPQTTGAKSTLSSG